MRRAPGTAESSPREHGVARLLGQGLTNRQIAAGLVVSVKTAEFLWGNAFTKLGVPTRTQLAARLEERPKN